MKKLLLLLAIMMCAAVVQAADNMQSTSMYNRTSTNSPVANVNITAPGAAAPAAMYSTTYDQASRNMRKATNDYSYDDDDPTDVNPGNPMPIGAPLIPLIIMAAAYGVSRVRKEE